MAASIPTQSPRRLARSQRCREGVRAIDALRAQVAAAAPSCLVEHTEEGNNVGYSHAPTDVPRQFATPPVPR